jgi:murein DD-endopeptidase MepM/ murein hydrolase activator NlpD
MAFGIIRRCGLARAGFAALLAGLMGGCAEQGAPAPVFLRGDAAGGVPAFTPIPSSPMPPPGHVVVRRGQTLDGYAYTYHVPRSAIIAANNLRPPYELKAGQRLIIPTGGRPVPPPLAAAPVMLPRPVPPPTQVALSPPQPAAVPQPPSRPETIAPAAAPEVIPLDGPPPKEAAAAPATLTPPKPAGPPSPQQQQTSPPPPAAAAEAGGRFPWPVRGHVLANYGNTPGGGHNDGINIAAPRGTPVHAIDAGTVAYSGNEVKGYGNILLIRHANGWISAYAHLDDVTVKPGQAVSAGEVIAKVGDSGGVGQPQLHFELRRGKKPVDPKEFLAPAPSA